MPDDYGYPNYAAGSKSYEPFRLVNVYKKVGRVFPLGWCCRARSRGRRSPVAGGARSSCVQMEGCRGRGVAEGRGRGRPAQRQQGKNKTARQRSLTLFTLPPTRTQAKNFAKTTYRKAAYKAKEAVDKLEHWSRRAK